MWVPPCSRGRWTPVDMADEEAGREEASRRESSGGEEAQGRKEAPQEVGAGAVKNKKKRSKRTVETSPRLFQCLVISSALLTGGIHGVCLGWFSMKSTHPNSKAIPLKAGPRICLGKDFAYRQMKILTIALMR
ncbi:hypothetical protein AgCh_033916 [Apium graveolens]